MRTVKKSSRIAPKSPPLRFPGGTNPTTANFSPKAGRRDPLSGAKWSNTLGKFGFLCLIVVFNVVFWITAVYEYLLPPEAYL